MVRFRARPMHPSTLGALGTTNCHRGGVATVVAGQLFHEAAGRGAAHTAYASQPVDYVAADRVALRLWIADVAKSVLAPALVQTIAQVCLGGRPLLREQRVRRGVAYAAVGGRHVSAQDAVQLRAQALD